MSVKAWMVGPYDDDWVITVHRENRGQARLAGSLMQFDDFTDMRAIRAPDLDGKVINNQVLLDAGFPETWEGEPLDFFGYIRDCHCELCRQAIRESLG